MRKKAVVWGICFFLQMSFITWGITLSAILRRLTGEEGWFVYPSKYTVMMREYGFLLYVLPIAWTILVLYSYKTHQSQIEDGHVLVSGVILTFFLLGCAFAVS